MKISLFPSHLYGTVTAPPSKSVGHRSIICAALSGSRVTVRNCGESDDITATTACVEALGSAVVRNGKTLVIKKKKKGVKDIVLDCRESGSTARFMIPVAAALGVENAEFKGSGRLPERPFGIIAEALRKNGVACSSDKLPLTVSGRLKSGVFEIPGNVSSQYISGLLLALSVTEGESRIVLTSKLESAAYVDITLNELSAFGADIEKTENVYKINGKPSLSATERTVEGDWSQAAFFLCAGAVSDGITVSGVDAESMQGDREIIDLLRSFGATVTVDGDSVTVSRGELRGIEIDASQIPDLVPVLAVTAALAKGKTVIKNAERLRLKESDRLKETVLRLKSFGINAEETSDGMIIEGGKPKAAEITSANDHRIVMAFSILAANADGESTIDGYEAINKSYPDFFEDYRALGGNAKCHQA